MEDGEWGMGKGGGRELTAGSAGGCAREAEAEEGDHLGA